MSYSIRKLKKKELIETNLIQRFEELLMLNSKELEPLTNKQILTYLYELEDKSRKKNHLKRLMFRFFTEHIRYLDDFEYKEYKINDSLLYKNDIPINYIDVEYDYLKAIYTQCCNKLKVTSVFVKFVKLRLEML